MARFTTTILKFEEHADKTGWTYIKIPREIAEQLKPGNKRSFRVKGLLDNYAYEGVSLLPMGEGSFIMPLNAAMRKGIRKQKDAKLTVTIQEDNKPLQLPEGFMESLEDEPRALEFFNSLTPSHQHYFLKWISSAKTEQTRVKRITQAITAFTKRQDYPTMIRSQRL